MVLGALRGGGAKKEGVARRKAKEAAAGKDAKDGAVRAPGGARSVRGEAGRAQDKGGGAQAPGDEGAKERKAKARGRKKENQWDRQRRREKEGRGEARAGDDGEVKKKKRGSRGGRRIQADRMKKMAQPLPEETEASLKELGKVAASISAALQSSKGMVSEVGRKADPALKVAYASVYGEDEDASGGPRAFLAKVKELEASSSLPKGATAALLAPGVKPQRGDGVLVTAATLCEEVDAAGGGGRTSPHCLIIPAGKSIVPRANGTRESGGKPEDVEVLLVDAASVLEVRGERGARVVAVWRLEDETEGAFHTCGFLADGHEPSIVSRAALLRPSPLDKATFSCHGGPWLWEDCTIRSSEGDALQVHGWGEAVLWRCGAGGICEDMPARNALVADGVEARLEAHVCRLEWAQKEHGAGASLWGQAHARFDNCTFRHNGYGIAMVDEPRVDLRSCLLSDNSWCFYGVASEGSMSLFNTMYFGDDIWVDDDVPEDVTTTTLPNGCKDYLRGRCARAMECKFAHDVACAATTGVPHHKKRPPPRTLK